VNHCLKRLYLLVLDPTFSVVVSFELIYLVFELPHKALQEYFTLSLLLELVGERLHLHSLEVSTLFLPLLLQLLVDVFIEGVALQYELGIVLGESLPDLKNLIH
jgi:hypothetical protein